MNKKNHCLKRILIFVATLLMGLGLTSCKKESRNLSPIDTIRNLDAAIKTEDVSSFITCYDQFIRNKLQKQKVHENSTPIEKAYQMNMTQS